MAAYIEIDGHAELKSEADPVFSTWTCFSPSSSVKARQLRIVTPILQKTWLGKKQNIELKRKYLSSKQFILSAPRRGEVQMARLDHLPFA